MAAQAADTKYTRPRQHLGSAYEEIRHFTAWVDGDTFTTGASKVHWAQFLPELAGTIATTTSIVGGVVTIALKDPTGAAATSDGTLVLRTDV